jgi:hypothetical protein
MPSLETDHLLVCPGMDMGESRNGSLWLFEELWDLHRAVELERHSVEGIPHRLIEVDVFAPSLSVETP